MTLWVLILLANIDRGGASVSIPMQSEQACVRAITNWKAHGDSERFVSEAGRYAYCVNTVTGEIKP